MLNKIFQNKVFQNFSYLTIGNIISQLLGLIALIKIAKIFSPSDYGIYTFMLMQGQLLMTVGDLGIRNIVIRTVARDKDRSKELLITGISLKFFAIVGLSLLYIFYNHFWGNLSLNQIIVLILFSILNCYSNLFESILWGNQKMLISSAVNISWSVIWVALIYLLPSGNLNVLKLFIIFTILGIIKGGAFYIVLLKKNLVRGKVQKSFLYNAKNLISESWPYLSLIAVMLPVNYFSNNFLDINSTTSELGYYNLANKLMSPVTLVIGFALSALFPNLSLLWEKDPIKFKAQISRGFRVFIIGALLLCFLFTLFSKEVILILFSDKYLPTVEVCQLQIWYVFLMGVNSLIGTIWGAANKEKLIFKTAIVNALLTTPFLYWGSKFGALGISYGYVISFAVFEIYLWLKFKKSLNIDIRGDKSTWSLAVSMFFISYFVLSKMDFIWRIITAVVILILFLLFFLKKNKKFKIII